MSFDLYHYWRSSCSWRVRWALEYKNIPFTTKDVNLLKSEHKSKEYLKLNPIGVVPTLKVGEQTLVESYAILEWLEKAHPNPSLLPDNLTEQAQVRALCMVIISGTQPLQNMATQKYVSSEKKDQQRFAQHWIKNGFQAFEGLLHKYNSSGKFCFNDMLTLADICLIPQCYNARRFSVDLKAYPTIAKIEKNALKLESCIKSHPDHYAPKES